MIPIRKVFNDDQVLLVFSMSCITALIIVGLVMLAFAPAAKGETVVPLVSIGVATIATFVRQPAFPAAPLTPAGEKGATGKTGDTGETGKTGATGGAAAANALHAGDVVKLEAPPDIPPGEPLS